MLEILSPLLSTKKVERDKEKKKKTRKENIKFVCVIISVIFVFQNYFGRKKQKFLSQNKSALGGRVILCSDY